MLSTDAPKPLRWQRSNYSPLARQIDIFGSAAQWMLYLWWDRISPNDSLIHKKRRAEWLVRTLIDLGPTFIKIGQALSTRADLLPLEYVQALGQLQDRVPEFRVEEAIALVEAELGKSTYVLFRDFERFPIAAASLGQVHKARLHTGEDVVVKVQRPGLEKLFDLDFKILYRLVRFCQRFLPWTRKYELEVIYNEFFDLLYQEIDYVQEGKNSDRFRENFNGYPDVIVPKVYWQYTTTKILTAEYVPGIKVDDRKKLEQCGLDVKKITSLGICCYLKQLLQDGFFQADPHPGNMAVSMNGSIIIYDFGMMVELKSLAKDQMVRTFFAVLKKDTDQVVDSLIDMGLIVPVSNMTPIRQLIKFMLDKFTEKPIDIQAFGEMRNEIYIMFQQQPFRLPAQMTFILRSLTTLDGIARTLDPEYNLIAAARPFIQSITVSKGQGSVIGELARQARDFIKYKLQQPSATKVLIRSLEARIERDELLLRLQAVELKRTKLALHILTCACFSGFTLMLGVALLAWSYKTLAIATFSLSALGLFLLLQSVLRK
jgi:predicted unusual protein kinase regulating ubiquinone biosynthesis (AarF/ABC1/UbiB family)